MLEIVTPGIIRVPGFRVEAAMSYFVITTREEVPHADRDWRWEQQTDLPPCEDCGQDDGQIELGMLFELKDRRLSWHKVACLDSICLPCARELIARNCRPAAA